MQAYLEALTQLLKPNTKQNVTLASLIPVSFVFGRSSTRKAAKFAVYEATMIIANPAQTIPSTRAEKLRGVPEILRKQFIPTVSISK